MDDPGPKPALDAGAFAAACAERRPGLYAYALTCCGDPHLAEDIVQETLLIATRKRANYSEESDFGLWLVAIARNVWFREREKAAIRRRRHLPQPVEELAIELVDIPAPAWERETEALRRCVAGLGAEDRRLLDLHFQAGSSYAEAATVLSRSLAWVKVRMLRLRRGLLECVQRRIAQAGHA